MSTTTIDETDCDWFFADICCSSAFRLIFSSKSHSFAFSGRNLFLGYKWGHSEYCSYSSRVQINSTLFSSTSITRELERIIYANLCAFYLMDKFCKLKPRLDLAWHYFDSFQTIFILQTSLKSHVSVCIVAVVS